MKNRNSSARTAAQKSTKVETQIPSSHSDGNTLVVCSHCKILESKYNLLLGYSIIISLAFAILLGIL